MDKRPISIPDENLRYSNQDAVSKDEIVATDAESDSVVYWKQRALNLEKILKEKLQESIEKLEIQSTPIEELSRVLKRADDLHFVLHNTPVVIGHQDKELRYRFVFNHFPSLGEQDIIGKTDVEIFSGAGVVEFQDFKREVLERGLPAKREITFETELFGSKTFLMYVEPLFSKAGDTIGVKYMGMEVTDQVKKREKMAKLREEIAVQKAKETELNKTIHITEETMRAKQMLATMSHEIRSPLSGVVSMAEILSTTKLDNEQRQKTCQDQSADTRKDSSISKSEGDQNESVHANKNPSSEESKLNKSPEQNGDAMDEDKEIHVKHEEPVVRIRCDI